MNTSVESTIIPDVNAYIELVEAVNTIFNERIKHAYSQAHLVNKIKNKRVPILRTRREKRKSGKI